VVNEITPTYYAGGEVPTEFTLHGSGFLSLPSNARGILSYFNDQPLNFQYDMEDSHNFDIEVLDDNTLRATYRSTAAPQSAKYLGGIVSQSGNAVYWVNETRPLP
jgi:hypothetical protein